MSLCPFPSTITITPQTPPLHHHHHHHHHCVPPARIFLSLFPIIHHFWLVLRATSRIFTEHLYFGSSWSSGFYSAIWAGLLEYITYELVPASPAVSRMSGLSNFDSFRDRRLVAEFLLCWVLPLGLVQNCSQHSCVVVPVTLFNHFRIAIILQSSSWYQ